MNVRMAADSLTLKAFEQKKRIDAAAAIAKCHVFVGLSLNSPSTSRRQETKSSVKLLRHKTRKIYCDREINGTG